MSRRDTPEGASEQVDRPAVSRRTLLGIGIGAGVGAGAGLFSAAPALAAPLLTTPRVSGPVGLPRPGAPAAPPAPPTPALQPFPQQSDLNFETLFAISESAYGAGEYGEVAATIALVQADIAAAGANAIPAYQPFNDRFLALAQGVKQSADDALAAGQTITARSRYLRAASYFNLPLFFALGTSDPGGEAELYAQMQACWAAAAALLDPVYTRVEISASVRFPKSSGSGTTTRNITIPAYWVRAPGDGPKPTVIVNNGSDAQFVDVYAYGAASAVERGFNALIFEGPGQGSMLFEQNIPFTPYWGDVITPLVDWVVAQPETEADCLFLTGWSFGGLLVLRAAAAEHRFKGVVADPGYHDQYALWSALTGPLEQYFGGISNQGWAEMYASMASQPYGEGGQLGTKFTVNKRGEIFGSALHDQAASGGVITDIVSLLAAAQGYNADNALLGQITSNVLVVSYEEDSFFSEAPQTQATLDALTGAASLTPYTFTAAQGAQYHCAPMAPQFRNEVVLDWIERICSTAPAPPSPTPSQTASAQPILPPTGGAEAGALGALGTGLAAAGAAATTAAAVVNRGKRRRKA